MKSLDSISAKNVMYNIWHTTPEVFFSQVNNIVKLETYRIIFIVVLTLIDFHTTMNSKPETLDCRNCGENPYLFKEKIQLISLLHATINVEQCLKDSVKILILSHLVVECSSLSFHLHWKIMKSSIFLITLRSLWKYVIFQKFQTCSSYRKLIIHQERVRLKSDNQIRSWLGNFALFCAAISARKSVRIPCRLTNEVCLFIQCVTIQHVHHHDSLKPGFIRMSTVFLIQLSFFLIDLFLFPFFQDENIVRLIWAISKYELSYCVNNRILVGLDRDVVLFQGLIVPAIEGTNQIWLRCDATNRWFIWWCYVRIIAKCETISKVCVRHRVSSAFVEVSNHWIVLTWSFWKNSQERRLDFGMRSVWLYKISTSNEKVKDQTAYFVWLIVNVVTLEAWDYWMWGLSCLSIIWSWNFDWQYSSKVLVLRLVIFLTRACTRLDPTSVYSFDRLWPLLREITSSFLCLMRYSSRPAGLWWIVILVRLKDLISRDHAFWKLASISPALQRLLWIPGGNLFVFWVTSHLTMYFVFCANVVWRCIVVFNKTSVKE